MMRHRKDRETADEIAAPGPVVADALGHEVRWRIVDLVETVDLAIRVSNLSGWLGRLGSRTDREHLHEHLRILDDAGAVDYDPGESIDDGRVGPTPETALFVDVLEDIHGRSEVDVR